MDILLKHPQVSYFLRLRGKQFAREWQYISRKDPFGVVIGLVVCAFFCGAILALADRLWGALILAFAGISLVWNIHRFRKDAPFLESLTMPTTLIYTCEYALLLLPLVCIITLAAPLQNIAISSTLLLVSLFIARFPQQQRLFSFRQKYIPFSRSFFHPYQLFVSFFSVLAKIFPSIATAFEWQAGVRQRGWFVGALMIVGLFMSHEILLLALCAFAAAISPVEFYGRSEPASMLQPLRQRFSPRRLLWFKIQQGWILEMVVLMPFWVCWSVRYATSLTDTALALFAVSIFALLLISITVISKYAFWKPNINQTVLVSVMVVWAGVLLWQPMLFPMPQVLIWLLWRKAERVLGEVH
jgi:hypothetical protein